MLGQLRPPHPAAPNQDHCPPSPADGNPQTRSPYPLLSYETLPHVADVPADIPPPPFTHQTLLSYPQSRPPRLVATSPRPSTLSSRDPYSVGSACRLPGSPGGEKPQTFVTIQGLLCGTRILIADVNDGFRNNGLSHAKARRGRVGMSAAAEHAQDPAQRGQAQVPDHGEDHQLPPAPRRAWPRTRTTWGLLGIRLIFHHKRRDGLPSGGQDPINMLRSTFQGTLRPTSSPPRTGGWAPGVALGSCGGCPMRLPDDRDRPNNSTLSDYVKVSNTLKQL
jgi:hypothetical protein